MVGYMQIGRFAPLSCCWLMLSCILSTYCRRWICKILLKSKALMPKGAYFAKCCAQTMVNGFETKEDSCTDVHIPLHHFSQGVGYITSSQWFWRNFECNRFPGHQVWILNATNFLKNWGGVKIAPCNAIQQVTFCYKQGLLLKSSSDTVIANCRGSCTL